MLTYVGQHPISKQPCDLSQLIGDMEDLLRNTVHEHIELNFRHDQEHGPVGCELDSGRIRQVILNLILNADEAIGDSPGQISIMTGYGWEEMNNLPAPFQDGELTGGMYGFCEITDNGRGMDKKTMNRMFDPFFSTKFIGRGLGLAVVVGIIKSHGGALKVESSPGRGTTIRLLFPAFETAPSATTEDLQKTEEIEFPLFSGVALLADDEEMVRSVGEKILAKLGFDVLEAADGQEALDIYRDHVESTRLVILDVSMPKINGVETLRKMRAINPDVKAILASGYPEEHLTFGKDHEKPAAYIQKPFQLRELAARIKAILDTFSEHSIER